MDNFLANISSVKAIKFLSEKYNFCPQKKQGQNFLINENVLNKIVVAANLKNDDVILEIGPGFGGLTIKLAERAKKVMAIEKDKKLVRALGEILRDYKNIEIIEGDILDKELLNCYIVKLLKKNYKIVANLPYQITSVVLRKILENKIKPQEIVVMVQKEVGQKICAQSPCKKTNLLSVSVRFYAQPKILFSVAKDNFWPKPKVDSVVLKITPLNKNFYGQDYQEKEKDFFRIVKLGFSHRRRQLKNNLAGIFGKEKDFACILKKIGLDSRARAEELRVEDWLRLMEALKGNHEL